jgi:hypothetical protein
VTFEQIGPPPVEWGLTLCRWRHCAELAQVKIDGWPYCITHGDDELERAIAWELNPKLVGMLPALDEAEG